MIFQQILPDLSGVESEEHMIMAMTTVVSKLFIYNGLATRVLKL